MHDMSVTRRNVRLLGWFNFCNDFRIYGPVMVVYFAQVTGSYADAVLILAIAKIGSSLFELPTGVFSDYVGRRKTLLSGQVANILCIAAYGAGSSFTLLAIGALLEGLSFALFSGNQDAFLCDTLKDEESQQEFAEYQGRWRDVPSGARGFRARVGDRVAMAAAEVAVLAVAGSTDGGSVHRLLHDRAVAARRVVETNLLAHLRDALVPFSQDAKLRDVSIAAMLAFALGEAKHMFFPAYFATLWSSSGLGIASMLTHAFAMLGFRASGRVIKRLRELPVLLWTSISSILLGVGATATATVASPAISSLASFAYGPGMVARDTLMQRSFTDRQRATMGSLISLGGNLFYAVVVFALGWFADRIGPQYALLSAELMTISVVLLYWRLFGREARA
jgi:MFS family permease